MILCSWCGKEKKQLNDPCPNGCEVGRIVLYCADCGQQTKTRDRTGRCPACARRKKMNKNETDAAGAAPKSPLEVAAQAPRNAETSAGLRKLLEAKDCAVRAALHVAWKKDA